MKQNGTGLRLALALAIMSLLSVFTFFVIFSSEAVTLPIVDAHDPAQVTKAANSADEVQLVGVAVGKIEHTDDGIVFDVTGIEDTDQRVTVTYDGSVPDTFRTGRHLIIAGTFDSATAFTGTPGTLATKCPSKYQGADSSA